MTDKQQVSKCFFNKEYFIANPAALNDLRQFLQNLNRPLDNVTIQEWKDLLENANQNHVRWKDAKDFSGWIKQNVEFMTDPPLEDICPAYLVALYIKYVANVGEKLLFNAATLNFQSKETAAAILVTVKRTQPRKTDVSSLLSVIKTNNFQKTWRNISTLGSSLNIEDLDEERKKHVRKLMKDTYCSSKEGEFYDIFQNKRKHAEVWKLLHETKFFVINPKKGKKKPLKRQILAKDLPEVKIKLQKFDFQEKVEKQPKNVPRVLFPSQDKSVTSKSTAEIASTNTNLTNDEVFTKFINTCERKEKDEKVEKVLSKFRGNYEQLPDEDRIKFTDLLILKAYEINEQLYSQIQNVNETLENYLKQEKDLCRTADDSPVFKKEPDPENASNILFETVNLVEEIQSGLEKNLYVNRSEEKASNLEPEMENRKLPENSEQNKPKTPQFLRIKSFARYYSP